MKILRRINLLIRKVFFIGVLVLILFSKRTRAIGLNLPTSALTQIERPSSLSIPKCAIDTEKPDYQIITIERKLSFILLSNMPIELKEKDVKELLKRIRGGDSITQLVLILLALYIMNSSNYEVSSFLSNFQTHRNCFNPGNIGTDEFQQTLYNQKQNHRLNTSNQFKII